MGTRTLTMVVELTYETELMHEDSPEGFAFFHNDILNGESGQLLLHSSELGDTVGSISIRGFVTRVEGMDTQTIFDTVVAHLRQQGGQSLQGGNCAYRGDNGRSCAVGCLFTDAAYHRKLEGMGVGTPEVRNALALSGVDPTGDTLNLLRQLQVAHDNHSDGDWEHIEARFERIADSFGLVYTPQEAK